HRFALIVAETADYAVRAAIVLHLLHSGALARAIVEIAALGDNAVEHGADVLEPRLCSVHIGGRRRQSKSRRLSEIAAGKNFELSAALTQRPRGQRAAIPLSQQIEEGQKRGRVHPQPLHPRLRRMDALEQVIERKRAVARYYDLAVDDKSLDFQRAGRFDELGEISRQRPAGFRL